MADFPTAKTNAVDNVTDVLAKHINNLENKVGIDNSTDANSLDYKVGALEDRMPTGAIVGTTDTQTLTNKTLTSPTITSSTTGFGLLNANQDFSIASGSTKSITVNNYVYGFLFITNKSTGKIAQIAISFTTREIVYQDSSEFAITSTPSTSQTGIWISSSSGGSSDVINIKNGFATTNIYSILFIRLQ